MAIAGSKTKPRSAPKRAAKARFINLGANGKPTSGDHVAVHDRRTGLIWTAAPLNGGNGFTHADAMAAGHSVSLLGKKDWRAPAIEELLSIIDYTRSSPCVDPKHFKGPYGWTWTSTIYVGASGFARYVGLSNGDSSWGSQDNRLQALAVRASQSFGSRKAS